MRLLKTEMQIILQNIRHADTDDLLDRVTAYRAGMEPDVIGFIEDELERRGVAPEEIEAHAEQLRAECLFHADGTAQMCSFCRRPAVAAQLGWRRLFQAAPEAPRPRFFLPGWVLYRLFRLLPLGYPWQFRYCTEHRRGDG